MSNPRSFDSDLFYVWLSLCISLLYYQVVTTLIYDDIGTYEIWDDFDGRLEKYFVYVFICLLLLLLLIFFSLF